MLSILNRSLKLYTSSLNSDENLLTFTIVLLNAPSICIYCMYCKFRVFTKRHNNNNKKKINNNNNF